jgi:hypothetical protein
MGKKEGEKREKKKNKKICVLRVLYIDSWWRA